MATMFQVPYKRMALYFRPEYRKNGVSLEETINVIRKLGYSELIFNQPDQQVNIKERSSILSVDSLNLSGHTHSLFWTGHYLFDPSKLDAYKKIPDVVYRVIQVIEPTPWDFKIPFKVNK